MKVNVKSLIRAEGFGWEWANQSIVAICEKYGNDELVNGQFHLIWDWLDKQAKGVGNV